jgi:phosphate transport system protein
MTLTNKDLNVIRSKLAVMGKISSDMFSDAVLAVSKSDQDLAREVIARDSRVDSMENEIEVMCLNFLALKAPKALELRYAVAVTRLTSEIERIADHSTVLCRESLARHLGPMWGKNHAFGQMAAMTEDMLKRALNSFFASDDSVYITLLEDDKKIGEKQRLLNDNLIAEMAKDPEKAIDAVSLMNIIRRIERVADHAKNISVMVPYVTKGTLLRHNPEAGEDVDNDD